MKSFYLALLALGTIFVGCESDDDSAGSASNSVIELSAKVRGRTAIGREAGEIGFYDTGNYRIYVDSSTKITRSRPSCSGMDSASFNEVALDDTIFVKYRAEDAIWSPSPPAIVADSIEAYSPECLSYQVAPASTNDCGPCGFMN